MDYNNLIKNAAKWQEVDKLYYEYEKRKMELTKKWEIGRLIHEAEQKEKKVVGPLSIKLSNFYDYSYSYSYLFYYRKYYQTSLKPVNNCPVFSWHHMRRLLSVDNIEERRYYIDLVVKENLTTKMLNEKIKGKSYEKTSQTNQNNYHDNVIMTFQNAINPFCYKHEVKVLAHLKSFLSSFTDLFIVKENYLITGNFGIKYLDFLLFSIKSNCYIAVLLSLNGYELLKEKELMNAMDVINKKTKEVFHNKTLGLLVYRQDMTFAIKHFGKENFTLKPYEIYSVNI